MRTLSRRVWLLVGLATLLIALLLYLNERRPAARVAVVQAHHPVIPSPANDAQRLLLATVRDLLHDLPANRLYVIEEGGRILKTVPMGLAIPAQNTPTAASPTSKGSHQ